MRKGEPAGRVSAAGNGRDDADFVALFERGVLMGEEADILLVDVDVHKATDLTRLVQKPFPDAVALEQRLKHSLDRGGLLVLTVEPRLASRAESGLLRRFGQLPSGDPGLHRLCFDALLLKTLREQATALDVDWNLVLRADAAEPGSRDWNNLLRLVQRTLPTLKAALIGSPSPILIVNSGLLARFELMSLVSDLQAETGRPGHTPSAWLLLPTHQPGVAAIDGVAVPLVNRSAAIAVPQAWLENLHRALTGAFQ